jgi:putative transposase
MSRKMTKFSTQLKTRLVLEVLREEKTLNEIASANNINPKNLQNWKKLFLENAEVAMEPAKAVKEYKDEVAKLQVEVDDYAKLVGQLTKENNWMQGKLSSLDSSYKKELIDRDVNKALSVVKQCELVDYNRSNLFYIPMVNFTKVAIKRPLHSNPKNKPTVKAHKQGIRSYF